MENFAVFILTYGRPDNVITYKTLKKQGYTGEIYFVCSTDDKTIPKYEENYPNQVITFNKEDYHEKFDIGDNFNDRRSVVYARNAVYDIAETLNKEYFLVLDDDYTGINYRFNENFQYGHRNVQNLDKVFELTLEYYKTIPALAIAYAQGGDFIGGAEGSQAQSIQIKRKIMNSFFSSTKRRIKYVSRLNDDVSTYTTLGNRGKLVFQTNQLCIEQIQTQASNAGLTDLYLDNGTYVKSFYTVMFAPSCTKISLMGNKDMRLHHFIQWNNAASKILNERYKL